MHNELTVRQKEVLEALKKYVQEHNYAPAYRDLCTILGVKSPSTISAFLHSLKKKGYIS